MFALIVVAGLFAAAQAAATPYEPVTGKPVACCEKPRGYIADAFSKCIFWQCVDAGHGYIEVRGQRCAPGTRVPDNYYSPGVANPCSESIKYDYKTKAYESCERAYALSYPEQCDPHGHKKGVTCFDCNVELGSNGYAVGGTSDCLLENPGDAERLDKWTCHSGKCFIRYETVGKYGYERKFLVRGCADGLSPLIDTSIPNCDVNTDYNKWYFCDGVISEYPCNGGNPCKH